MSVALVRKQLSDMQTIRTAPSLLWYPIIAAGMPLAFAPTSPLLCGSSNDRQQFTESKGFVKRFIKLSKLA